MRTAHERRNSNEPTDHLRLVGANRLVQRRYYDLHSHHVSETTDACLSATCCMTNATPPQEGKRSHSCEGEACRGISMPRGGSLRENLQDGEFAGFQ